MTDFRLVYLDPDRYRSFICEPDDADFEGQNFDRKEAGRPDTHGRLSKASFSSLLDHVERTISAFANATGGLLVLGISNTGEVTGIEHINEQQRTAVLSATSLRGAPVNSKLHNFTTNGQTKQIALLMVEANDRTFCCRVKDDAGWIRRGPSTMRLLGEELEQIKRDRKVVEFERSQAGTFAHEDIESHVVKEFTASHDLDRDRSANEVLYDAGAILRRNKEQDWTNAGLLFFAFNPQRLLEHAHIRLLRFDCSLLDEDERPTPDFDRRFDGPITQQIRDLRTFFEESAFFKTFERRSPEGGFLSQPEYPAVAIDEALVNAVAHRDYGITRPILCEKYTDAFVVKSPGSLRQPQELPNTFRLNEVQLESIPRNAKLMEWLRGMKDAKGASYVKALREGTRKMRDEMNAVGLPPPTYRIGTTDTVVILENDIAGRTSQPTGLAGDHAMESSEFTNLYLLAGMGGSGAREGDREERRILLQAICQRLEAQAWVIDAMGMGRAVVHVKDARHQVPEHVGRILRIIPAYVLNIRSYFNRHYLAIDYTVRVQTIWRASQVADTFGTEGLIGLRAFGAPDGRLLRGRIVKVLPDSVTLRLQDVDDEVDVSVNRVFPSLKRQQLDELLSRFAPDFDLSRTVKTAAHSMVQGGARRRAEQIARCASIIRETAFPIVHSARTIALQPDPLILSEEGDGKRALRIQAISEPEVEFGGKRSTANIREGITTFGSYKDEPKELEIVGIVEAGLEQKMRDLVDRLRTGSFKYRGAERTFATRLRLAQVNTAIGCRVDEECRRLVDAYPEWKASAALNRLMLVHTPEAGFSVDDVRSPYYQAKRALLEAGIPCQMIDTPTLTDPNYKDLNLALNIVAKTGVTPWVLPETIPDADFFVGLSYTSSQQEKDSRIVGFANVFNQYGRWEFYSGGNEAVPFRDRASHYEVLVRETLAKLELREHPTVYFHYSAKFSRREREAICRGARAVRPNGRFVFVWINSHHPVKLFDDRPETDGSVARGRYVVGGRNQIYLSTTGHNPYRKALGRPHALEINVYLDDEQAGEHGGLDHRSMAGQVLSLTKLNWASTDALCGEPITIRYAKSIAYLTAAFQRQEKGAFKLHSVLERTPWFI